MKMSSLAAALAAALLSSTAALGAPFLSINDFIIAIDTDEPLSLSSYPGAESPINALDDTVATKYLNFGETNTGLIFTPANGSSTVRSMLLRTANDAVERDPVSWKLYGTNAPIASVDNGTGSEETWTLIAENNVALPAARLTDGPLQGFTNNTAYTSYRVLFPTVKNPATANSMQIADINLFPNMDGTGNLINSASDTALAFQLPTFQSRFNAAEAPNLVLDGTGPNLTIPAVSSYPGNESPANTVDGTNAKYLNFGGIDSGFIVTPASGPAAVRSFQITTANDAEPRDPAAWTLFGTNDPIASADNSYGLGETWTTIDSGTLELPFDRNTLGDVVTVDNNTSYASYKMQFTDWKSTLLGVAANSIQIAEASFFSSADGSGTDILSAGDPIRAFDATVRMGLETKYLNFGKENSGVIITPAAGAKVLTGFQITTANNAIESDPASYELYGTNDPITSEQNSQGDGENWTLIASGALALPDERSTEGDLVSVTNTTSYTSYRLIFPQVKDAVATSMHIAGLQFFDSSVAPDADFNNDGQVNAADLTIWKTAHGTNAQGDADGDGDSDGNDFLVWQRSLGSSGVGAVPEPSVALLTIAAVVGGAGAVRRASRRRPTK